MKTAAIDDRPRSAESEAVELDSSLARLLKTLRLFTRQEPVLAAETVAQRLRVPLSTAYRYVKQLTDEGLLVRWKGGYTLGPRIIELDLQMRESDPVISAATEPMRKIVEKTGLEVLLSKLYGSTVMTIHIESADKGPHLTYGRGRPLPLFRGSTSKAITAFLPAARLRKLFDAEQARTPAAAQSDWQSFYDEAVRIRRQGYCISRGELNSGIEGISAPVFLEGRVVAGSITVIRDSARVTHREDALVELVTSGAAAITAALQG